MIKKIGIGIGVIILVCVSIFMIYVSDYSKADETAMAIYEENGNSLEFVGDNKDVGFIIYPGGKVDEIAYVGIAKLLNDKGYTSVIASFPFNIGFMGINKADEIIAEYPDIDKWVLVGHSLGGVAGSVYVEENSDKIDGLVFLASYSTDDLKDNDVEVLSIVGSNDTVLNRESYDEAKVNYDEDSKEIVIEGGNHSGFGDYGDQKGDGESTITNAEQQQITVDAIIEFANSLE